MRTIRVRPSWLATALFALAACADRTPTAPLTPTQTAPAQYAAATCSVDVPRHTLQCASATLPRTGTSPRGDKYIGGQEKYVKLTSSGVSYDNGTQILSASVTVQNLLQQVMGTQDGTTVLGVKVFFSQQPSLTSGSGNVSVFNNGDGLGTFTAANQPYYAYNQIIDPFEISSARTWQFAMDPTVTGFVFTVYVDAPLPDESGALVDKVWTGAVSTDWFASGNWQGGVIPDSASTVQIPPDSLLTGAHNQPVLSASTQITNLRVGYGSTLALGGFTLTAWGNVDAPGSVTGGTLYMRGSSTVLGGTVNAAVIGGSTALQRATKATAAVSVTGTLAVKDQTLTISIP